MFVDLKEVLPDGDEWEAFARDFLVILGFTIDTPPNRGADGGKDMIVTESLSGTLGKYPFRWMVSCKHKAHSGKAVSEADEPNILERVRSLNCDGFIGIYSTLPTSALSERLRGLRDNRGIRDYRLFDARLIENHLVRLGYSKLLMRCFPLAYQRLKPLHALTGTYIPLKCMVCDRDMLDTTTLANYRGLVGFARRIEPANSESRIVDVYWACKGTCDQATEQRFMAKGCSVGWEDISDLVIPAWYLRFVFALLTRVRDADDVYEDNAYNKLKTFMMALGQKVFRELTDEERHRFKELLDMPIA
jgi:hypothetical protein